VAATKRILVSGMGSELGTRVAALLEELPWAGEIVGVDIDPPRGRLRRAIFHRIDPRERRRMVDLLSRVDPQIVLHLGVDEPNARATPSSAAARTEASAVAVLGAAAEASSLEAVVVRSGIEVYGRGAHAPTRPDEAVLARPTTAFGRSLATVEALADEVGRVSGVPPTILRFAPVLGPHVASPLGRYLRLPAVPVDLLSDPTFALIHVQDAAKAVVAAARAGVVGPVNVVAAGAVTPRQAVRMGNRLPVPVAGPPWWLARPIAALVGAPVPDHLVELLTRGRMADGGRAVELLGVAPELATEDVVKELYRWASVTHLRPATDAAA
jgi:UDP-glucose 4-epimerase